MKVYVITQGEYSDYGIVGVAIDEDQAKRISALKSTPYEECNIEEYDTDDIQIDSTLEIKKWCKMLLTYSNLEIMSFSYCSCLHEKMIFL